METQPKIIPGHAVVTLRDHIAIAAMQALVSSHRVALRHPADKDGVVDTVSFPVLDHCEEMDEVAHTAYRIADHMLAQRDAVEEPETIPIIINGSDFEVSPEVSYELILRLAEERDGATVTYCSQRSGDCQRSGILSRGKKVKVEPGMQFTAVMTNNA